MSFGKNALRSLSFWSLLLITSLGNAQTHQCGDDVVRSLQKSNRPAYDELERQNNLAIRNYIATHFSDQQKSTSATNYLIPVVFHVVHPVGQTYGTGSNISYQQIVSQINALNAAFAKNYPAYNGQSHPAYAQNTDIKFCLASNPSPSSLTFYNGPNGIEKGVIRYADNTLTNHQISNTGANALLALTHPTPNHFPFANYLNIWIVTSVSAPNSSGIIMGYAPTPLQASFPLDGVVMRSDVIGDNTVSSNNFSLGYGLTQGKILAHEVGHYLNLYHIFEGGCAGANASTASSDQCDLNGDMICDIEPCTTQNFNCNLTIPNTCTANYPAGTTTNDMVEDYMSYADDDCMNTFTMDQKLRMHATLNTLRSNLWNVGNLAQTGVQGPGGCTNSSLYANISKSANNICLNTALGLSNSSLGNTAISWTWTLNGATPNTASSSSVNVTYTAIGAFWAKLSVSDGTVTVKDSMLMSVSSCSLDPTKMNRANWFMGDYCSMSFTSGVPVGNNIAAVNNTIKCFEVALSESDSAGNLLFYGTSLNLWNSSHQLVNTSGPLFGYTVSTNFTGSSVYGLMTIQIPNAPHKYLLMCVPPFEYIGGYFPYPPLADKIVYRIYDTQTQTLSAIQHLTNTAIPFRMTEDMTIIPHCNGVDYWLITRGIYSYPASAQPCKFYSFLITQNGLSQNEAPVVSGPFASLSNASGCSAMKANKAGNRIITRTGGQGAGAPGCALYDFNSTTGMFSNEVFVPGFYLDTVNSTYKQLWDVNFSIFSPNGQYIYLANHNNPENTILQFNTANLNIAPKIFTCTTLFYSEIGPDNNIYFANANDNYKSMSCIKNPDSWTNSAFVYNTCSLNIVPTSSNVTSVPNYMESDKPAFVDPFVVQQTSCGTFSFALNPCWSIYTVSSWNFGDASATVTAQTSSHTYTAAGIYTVSLVMNYQGQNIPAYTKTVQVINPAIVNITGPNLICIGSAYLNQYSVPNISGATYSWTATNSSIAGFTTTPSIQLAGTTNGVATLSVLVSNGGCSIAATKTITVDSLPAAAFTNTLPPALCMGDSLLLTVTPPGGTLSGQYINGNYFKPTVFSATPFTVYYTRTSANGCTNIAALSITVAICTGVGSAKEDVVNILPNPTSGYITVRSDSPIQKLEVFSSLGKMVMEKTALNEKDLALDLARLPANIYFVRVYTAKGSVVRKVIKD